MQNLILTPCQKVCYNYYYATPKLIPPCTIHQYLASLTTKGGILYWGCISDYIQPLYYNVNMCKKMRVSPERFRISSSLASIRLWRRLITPCGGGAGSAVAVQANSWAAVPVAVWADEDGGTRWLEPDVFLVRRFVSLRFLLSSSAFSVWSTLIII